MNHLEDERPLLQWAFAVILLSRLALNMQMRVIYPFLPAISRGLGVPLQTTSLLLTARAVANLSSPLFGALADRFGQRNLMLAGLVILVSGSLWVALAPSPLRFMGKDKPSGRGVGGEGYLQESVTGPRIFAALVCFGGN